MTEQEHVTGMITSKKTLAELVEQARQKDAVAVDSEFVWSRTYAPKLGLIQLALSDEQCYLIDPITISDLSPLGELLHDPGVVKIFHDANQDLAILQAHTHSIPINIFDTRLAAGFAGLPATLSLGSIVKKLLDISLPKTETRTNWLKRPLAPEQVAYAMDDVRYLRAVRVILLSRIIGSEIKAWLQEELSLFNSPEAYNGITEDTRYTKIRGAKGMSSQSLAILRELCVWREHMARKTDKPRGHIIKDGILLEISKKKPHSLDEITVQAGLSKRAAERWGDEIITAVARGMAVPEKEQPVFPREQRLTKKNTTTLKQLVEFIQLKSSMQGLDPSLIGNSSELKKLVKLLDNGCPAGNIRQLQGWRKAFLNDFFRYAQTR